jgi:uncharacterized membrane protein YidH (DUF202 family)
VLAFFAGGGAAAAISFVNARRLGLAPKVGYQLLGLGGGFLLVFGFAVAAMGLHSMSLESGSAEEFSQSVRRFRLVTPLCSVGLAWLMVRLQLRADRLYQIERGDEEHYSSLWLPGLAAAIGSIALHLALPVLGIAAWRAGPWTTG